MSDVRRSFGVVIDVAQLAHGSVLSGSPSGRHLYGLLVAALPDEPDMPELLLLDFRDVEIATASYLRESVVAFRSFVRSRRSNLYPVVANARNDLVDDLFEVVQPRGDVVMICWTDDAGTILRWQTIGKLDPMQQLTFNLVTMHGETTATKLMEIEKSAVKTTAWNNRLASLSNLGLIREFSRGRTKFYKPLFNGGYHGG